MTDSEQVPRGKGEKHPERGVKQRLKPCAPQAAGAVLTTVTACLCRMSLRVAACGEVKGHRAAAKASLNRAI